MQASLDAWIIQRTAVVLDYDQHLIVLFADPAVKVQGMGHGVGVAISSTYQGLGRAFYDVSLPSRWPRHSTTIIITRPFQLSFLEGTVHVPTASCTNLLLIHDAFVQVRRACYIDSDSTCTTSRSSDQQVVALLKLLEQLHADILQQGWMYSAVD